ncbi:type 1 glutamine amidotransferase domain-containing protein, partial [Vibrio cholerae O1]|nr:type 1 glutamine amidotransferase domain-containing protein [Vibrio cholerae O1]
SEIQSIATSIYKNNGYLVSVCHGVAGLFTLKDEDGKYIISDKNIKGFNTAEERIAGKKKIVPFLNEKMAKEHGAT